MRILRLGLNAVLALGATLLLVACALHFSNSRSSDVTGKPDGSLRIATYNVHYIILSKATGAWSVGDWERRKAPLDAAFKAVDADVIGFQEMESFTRGNDGSVNLTLDYLLENNPAYAAAAIGDWREFPSTQPILYRRDVLRMLDQGWFFFSDTPDEIYSRTFNGSYPAYASWARFEDQSGTAFYVYNVHFEYKSASNRKLSAELVRSRIAPLIDAGETVFLIGDINGRADSQAVQILEDAGLDFAPVEGATYHFNRGFNLFGAIEHIAMTGGATLSGAPVVLRSRFLGEWPSDHYPVFADYLLE